MEHEPARHPRDESQPPEPEERPGRLITFATWSSRVRYLIVTGALLAVLVVCLWTHRWVVAAVCVPFLIGFLAYGPARLRGDAFRRRTGRN